jgi:Mn2+/Fe2+ NRAMP family transporter
VPTFAPAGWGATAVEVAWPGVITGAADDDPSGIATSSVAGAQLGTKLLWTALLTWPLMVAVQIMCARIGMVTEQGLAGSFKQRFPNWLLRVFVLGPACGNPRFANYVAAKGAQLGLTGSWARELSPTGITLNLVAPGWIPTSDTQIQARKI